MPEASNPYYFCYGVECHPYRGGWTIVMAPTREIAIEIYRAYHHDADGFLLCDNIYDSKQFLNTSMPEKGNWGAYCQEIITVVRTRAHEEI